MRAVVTGGGGFIGSHLTERLHAEGHEILVIDDLSSGESRVSIIEDLGIEIIRADIRSDQASAAIASFRPEALFHLAAQMDVRRSVDDPAFDADVNVLGTLRMLSAAADVGARFINTSSGGAMYGELPPDSDGFDEESRPAPMSPYGISKLAGEHYCRFFGEFRGIEFVSLALANVYGPRQDPHGEAGVVAIFGRKLLDSEPCVIYGDGKQTRDYVFVGDVVDAYLAALDRGTGETVNIGTGVETSVVDLYAQMASLIGTDAEPVFEPERAGELRRVALDVSRAERVLGWTPKTPLAEGLRAL
ncbi:MAG: NAD-dependent epimerase/dehydratase family protein [Actinobacteria bacterium]|nr:NAD-dependent epimerase/dehydratase family protein [Actinomycetota bacterium]